MLYRDQGKYLSQFKRREKAAIRRIQKLYHELSGWNRYIAARHVAGVLEVFAHSPGYANKAISENQYCIKICAIRLQNNL